MILCKIRGSFACRCREAKSVGVTTVTDVKVPPRLYKYRKFDDRAVPLLVGNTVYFADPQDFNDPLDTKPLVNPDLDIKALQNLLGRLFEERIKADMRAAMKKIRKRGPETDTAIDRWSREAAAKELAEILDNEPDDEYGDADQGGAPRVRLSRTGGIAAPIR